MAITRSVRRLSFPIFILAAWLGYKYALQQENTLSFPKWASSTSSPTVTTSQGILVGTTVNDGSFPTSVEAFLGIPYALPPTGELRFRRPVPVPPSEKTIRTTKYGPRCPGKQLLSLGGGPDIFSEDCLTVNVFRPQGAVSNGTKLPVAVYLHGGAFNRGAAKMHNSASLVGWSGQPLIVVSFNYRIGALGFLNSALTASEGVLNLGLHDQVLVLTWVHEHIGAFGGDVDNIALFGLSAGAHSIGHHILNVNSEKQLFHGAIMESGGPTSRALHPPDSKLHEDQFRQFLTETNCHTVGESQILQCLRALPEDVVIKASDVVFGRYNPSVRWAWQPVLDDELIARRTLDAWESGNWNKVPILTGFVHNEGTMYVPKNTSTSAEFESFCATLLPHLSSKDLKTINSLYPDPVAHADSPYIDTRDLPVGAQYKRVEAAYGQYAYICPVRHTAQLVSVAADNPLVYLYHWAVNRTVLGGANHGDQMYYETMNPDVRGISATQEKIAGLFHAYITSFLITGDPNAVEGRYPDRPRWEPFRPKAQKTMLFGQGNDERAGGQGLGVPAQFVQDTWAQKECDFWQAQSGRYED